MTNNNNITKFPVRHHAQDNFDSLRIAVKRFLLAESAGTAAGFINAAAWLREMSRGDQDIDMLAEVCMNRHAEKSR